MNSVCVGLFEEQTLLEIVALALSIDAEAFSDSWKSDKAAECCNFPPFSGHGKYIRFCGIGMAMPWL